MNGDNVTCFDSFGVRHISNGIKRQQKYHNIYLRIQANNSIMCGYFCIAFIDFMLNGRSLLDYANLFSRNDYEKNDKIILEHFQQLETKTSFLNGL